jgi:hypothetical protein
MASGRFVQPPLVLDALNMKPWQLFAVLFLLSVITTAAILRFAFGYWLFSN